MSVLSIHDNRALNAYKCTLQFCSLKLTQCINFIGQTQKEVNDQDDQDFHDDSYDYFDRLLMILKQVKQECDNGDQYAPEKPIHEIEDGHKYAPEKPMHEIEDERDLWDQHEDQDDDLKNDWLTSSNAYCVPLH